MKQGLGLSPLPQGERRRTIYLLYHARSGSHTWTASASPLSNQSRRSSHCGVLLGAGRFSSGFAGRRPHITLGALHDSPQIAVKSCEGLSLFLNRCAPGTEDLLRSLPILAAPVGRDVVRVGQENETVHRARPPGAEKGAKGSIANCIVRLLYETAFAVLSNGATGSRRCHCSSWWQEKDTSSSSSDCSRRIKSEICPVPTFSGSLESIGSRRNARQSQGDRGCCVSPVLPNFSRIYKPRV
jgi:hypothetical protein